MAYLPTGIRIQEVQAISAAQRTYSFAFPAIDPTDVEVLLDDVAVDPASVRVLLNDTRTSGQVRFLTRSETTAYRTLTDGQELTLRRSTAARDAISPPSEGYAANATVGALQERLVDVVQELVGEVARVNGADPLAVAIEVRRYLVANPITAGLDEDAVSRLIAAAIASFLTATQVQTRISNAVSEFLTATQIEALIPPAVTLAEPVTAAEIAGRTEAALRRWSPKVLYDGLVASLEGGVADNRFLRFERGELDLAFSAAVSTAETTPDRVISRTEWDDHDLIRVLVQSPTVTNSADNPYIVTLPQTNRIGTDIHVVNMSDQWVYFTSASAFARSSGNGGGRARINNPNADVGGVLVPPRRAGFLLIAGTNEIGYFPSTRHLQEDFIVPLQPLRVDQLDPDPSNPSRTFLPLRTPSSTRQGHIAVGRRALIINESGGRVNEAMEFMVVAHGSPIAAGQPNAGMLPLEWRCISGASANLVNVNVDITTPALYRTIPGNPRWDRRFPYQIINFGRAGTSGGDAGQSYTTAVAQWFMVDTESITQLNAVTVGTRRSTSQGNALEMFVPVGTSIRSYTFGRTSNDTILITSEEAAEDTMPLRIRGRA